MPAPAMNAGDWISAALALVQIAAIVLGALWAYYKFFKGRIFHKRAEPSVEGSLVSYGWSYAIRAKLSLKNTGSSDVPLRVTLLTLAAHEEGVVDEKGHAQWRDVARAHAFQDDEGTPDHDDVESQETITDEILIPIPTADRPENGVFAYRLICQVYERRKEGGGICWTTKTIIPVTAEALLSPAAGPSLDAAADDDWFEDPYEPADPLVKQRPASEKEIEEAERDG